MRNTSIFIFLFILFVFPSCKDNDTAMPVLIDTDASTYTFARDGQSSVHNEQQFEMAKMLDVLVSYTETGHTGAIVEARDFRSAFENRGDNGGGLFDFSSVAQLESNLIPVDLSDDYFGDIFEQAAIASKAGDQAANLVPGLILRESQGTDILVNNLGQDFEQFIEKGIMGSVFMHQMYSILMDDALIGEEVDNVNLVQGTNATALELNWDRAFGYFHAPGDFDSEWPLSRSAELKYWSAFSNIVDPSIGCNQKIMDAFRNGRTAIVDNNLSLLNENRAILIKELEILMVASGIHFINESIVHKSADNMGDLIHSLSAAYMSIRALNTNPNKLLIPSAFHNILNVDFGLGGNFWTVQLEGLEAAKEKLGNTYPELAAVADEL